MSTIELPNSWINPDLDLVGIDANALAIVGAVSKALRKVGNSKEVIDAYRDEAMSGDYDHLLRASIAYAGQNSNWAT